jgi:hypothetical protein
MWEWPEKPTFEVHEKQQQLKRVGTHVMVTWMDTDDGIKEREDVMLYLSCHPPR